MKIFSLAVLLTVLFTSFAASAADRRAAAMAPPPSESVQIPCSEVTRLSTNRVSESTSGYRTVDVAIDVEHSVAGAEHRLPANITFAFGLDSASRDIRHDEAGKMLWIRRCDKDVIRGDRVYKAGTTWLKVQGAVTQEDVWEDKKGITVHAMIWLPDDVVAAKPAAITILKDNRVYIGDWSTTKEGVPKLWLATP